MFHFELDSTLLLPNEAKSGKKLKDKGKFAVVR